MCFIYAGSIASKCAIALLNAGAKLDGPHYLAWAVKTHQLALSLALLRAGASGRAMISPQQSALHYALLQWDNTRVELVQALLAAGADANETLVDGTILETAVQLKRIEVRVSALD